MLQIALRLFPPRRSIAMLPFAIAIFCLLPCLAVSAAAPLPVLGLQLKTATKKAPQRIGLTPLAVHRNGQGSTEGLKGASAIAFSPDGRRAFVTGSRDDALSVWQVNPDSGSPLIQIAVYKDGEGGIDGLAGAQDVAASPDGKRLFVIGSAEQALSAWRLNQGTDNPLTQLKVYKDGKDGIDGLQGASAIALSPDGRRLFAVSISASALSVWRLGADTDNPLTQLKVYRNAKGSIDGLWAVSGIAVSPNGKLLFTVTDLGNALGVWRINAADDSPLTQLKVYRDGEEGISGLLLAHAVAVGPKSRRVYVAAAGDNALSAWQVNTGRDAAAEPLSLLKIFKGDGLFSVLDIAPGPDGRTLYAVATSDDALSVWQTGDSTAVPLRKAAVYKNGKDGIDGLLFVRRTAVSPDGRLLLTAGSFYRARSRDNTLSVWQTAPPPELPLGQSLTVRTAASTAPGRPTTVRVTARLGSRRETAEVLLGPATPAGDARFPAGLPAPGLWLFSAAAETPESLEAGAARMAVKIIRVKPKSSLAK